MKERGRVTPPQTRTPTIRITHNPMMISHAFRGRVKSLVRRQRPYHRNKSINGPAATQHNAAVGIVEEMTQATAALMKAMEEPTVAGLSRAIAQGTNMQQLHGTYCAETMQLASGVLAETTAAQMANRASSPRRAAAPPLPARRAPAPALPTRKEQAAAVGVAPETYQRQMEALSAVGTMSMGIKNSWGRMTDDAKLKKLLLIEGLCESLRSSIFEGDYRTWAQERLGMSLLMFFFF